MSDDHCITLVDDDPGIRRSLTRILAAEGHAVTAYADAEQLLAHFPHGESTSEPSGTACLLLDLRLPGMNGLELQNELLTRGFLAPMIFMTAYGDVASSVQAMRAGAMDYLQKPLSIQHLLSRVAEALRLHAQRRTRQLICRQVLACQAQLTGRERQVLTDVAAGLSTKAIARNFAISPRTVEKYRARMMEKMGARSVAELCSLLETVRSVTRDAEP